MSETQKAKLSSGARPISSPGNEVTLERLLAAIEEWRKQEANAVEPITITIAETSRMTGYGLTTIWKLIKEGKIKVLRRKDVRRTLPYLASVKELQAPQPPSTEGMTAELQPKRGRGRPRKALGRGPILSGV